MKTESATLDDTACYLGFRDGWVMEAPFAEDVRWRHLRLHRDTLVHLSTYEGYLVACSARQVTVIDLSHFGSEPHQRHRPFRDEGVTIQRARVVQQGGMAYLLVVGLDQRSCLHALTSPWRGVLCTTSEWHKWGIYTPYNKDFVWHPSGKIERRGWEPTGVLDITRHGQIVVTSYRRQCYLDLERGWVEPVRIPIPRPWPELSADQASSNLVCCSQDLQTSGIYFRSMVPFSQTPLGRLPFDLQHIIFNQVSMVDHMVEMKVAHVDHSLRATLEASMLSSTHAVISPCGSRAFAPWTVSTTPSCRRRRDLDSNCRHIH